ncbi:SDR family NAD(P)-dependent oxidoreductase [Rubrivirga sp.]|uniref:SDR family NAD(P)-dependent oxidoreductase n=1 Tax=Rubrivirga sp. TaxID=1885344 RepID=UPI003C72B725
MPDSFYAGRTVLVTGASSGIGAAMARHLGTRGARVLLVARREAALEAVARDVRAAGGEAVVLEADLEPPGAAQKLVDRVHGADEAVDVLVNNAGFGIRGPVLEAKPDALEGMVTLNVLALTVLTRLLLPGMVDRGRGGVLNVASIAAFTPAPQFAVYSATKAYVQSFSEALWAELDGSGVHCTCLCPGPVATEFGNRAGVGEGFFTSGLPAQAVARDGLKALARGRRRVVPGLWNKVQTAATRFVPPSVTIKTAQAIMRRAG